MFQIGDRIRCIDITPWTNKRILGESGTIVAIKGCAQSSYGVMFDNYICGHNLDNALDAFGSPVCPAGYGYWLFSENMELLDDMVDASKDGSVLSLL